MFASLRVWVRVLCPLERFCSWHCSHARGGHSSRPALDFASKCFSRRGSHISKDSAHLCHFEANMVGSTWMCSPAGRLEQASASGKEVRQISAGPAVMGKDVSALVFEPGFLGLCRSKQIGNHCSDFFVCSKALGAPKQASRAVSGFDGQGHRQKVGYFST